MIVGGVIWSEGRGVIQRFEWCSNQALSIEQTRVEQTSSSEMNVKAGE
jgi:hypothetical protein